MEPPHVRSASVPLRNIRGGGVAKVLVCVCFVGERGTSTADPAVRLQDVPIQGTRQLGKMTFLLQLSREKHTFINIHDSSLNTCIKSGEGGGHSTVSLLFKWVILSPDVFINNHWTLRGTEMNLKSSQKNQKVVVWSQTHLFGAAWSWASDSLQMPEGF